MIRNTLAKRPLVSVVMPVFNSAKFLKDALQSILNQSYQNFEFIIINDGSSDDSAVVIRGFSDSRIRFLDNPENKGLADVLNQGLSIAHGEFIVRMDSDDISVPDRIERQIAYMENNPDVGVCGGFAKVIGGGLMPRSNLRFNITELLLDNILIHPTVIMRKSVIDKFNLKYDGFVEDYRLWVKFARVSRIAVMPEILIHYRLSNGQFSVRCREDQTADANSLRVELFAEILDRPLSEMEQIFVSKNERRNEYPIRYLLEFCSNVFRSNKVYPQVDLRSVLQKLISRNFYKMTFHWRDIGYLANDSILSLRQKVSLIRKGMTMNYHAI